MTTTIATSSPDRRDWYRAGADETATALAVDPAHGLSGAEVRARQATFGANVLAGKEKETALRAFLRQYQDLMQIILVGAAVVNQIEADTFEKFTTLPSDKPKDDTPDKK